MLNCFLKNARIINMRFLFIIFSFLIFQFTFGQGTYQLAVLKYNGGGDYYANPTAVPNLVKFANQQLNANISTEVPYVEVGSPLLFTYPFVHMTGHGNVVFSNAERENLRNYLIGGGFLHIDDNYGMDQYIRPELEKLFPNIDLVELPFDHPLFNQKYKFHGLPKIHEHDGERPQAFGLIIEGRLRSEEHTSELQSRPHLVCRLLLEKKKIIQETFIGSDDRAWLVRYCARLAGEADLAEDLAQETLLEACRNLHKIYALAGLWPWLAA